MIVVRIYIHLYIITVVVVVSIYIYLYIITGVTAVAFPSSTLWSSFGTCHCTLTNAFHGVRGLYMGTVFCFLPSLPQHMGSHMPYLESSGSRSLIYIQSSPRHGDKTYNHLVSKRFDVACCGDAGSMLQQQKQKEREKRKKLIQPLGTPDIDSRQ